MYDLINMATNSIALTSGIKLIIFDIDGTLVDTQLDGTHLFNFDGTLYMTSKRPGFDNLMEYCFKNYDIGFYTAASSEYATRILKLFLSNEQYNKIKFIKSYKNCAKIRHSPIGSLLGSSTELPTHSGFGEYGLSEFIIKPLGKIWRKRYARENGWNRHNTIIVEDTQGTCIQNYGNAIYVPSYVFGREQKCDQILVRLIKYLDELRNVESVRSIEKRFWLLPKNVLM